MHEFQAAVYPQGKFPGQAVTLPVTAPNFSRSNRYKEGALYAQDSWKVTPRMTVNLGVRWEYYGVQHNNNPNLDANFYPGAGGLRLRRASRPAWSIRFQQPQQDALESRVSRFRASHRFRLRYLRRW